MTSSRVFRRSFTPRLALAPAALVALTPLFACGSRDGAGLLVLEERVAPGSACSAGGWWVRAGADDDGSGQLDPAEVTAETYVCDGAPGAAGPDAQLPLVRATSVDDPALCPHGGTRFDFGTDENGDSVLQDSEISSSSTACVGAPCASAPRWSADTRVLCPEPAARAFELPHGRAPAALAPDGTLYLSRWEAGDARPRVVRRDRLGSVDLTWYRPQSAGDIRDLAISGSDLLVLLTTSSRAVVERVSLDTAVGEVVYDGGDLTPSAVSAADGALFLAGPDLLELTPGSEPVVTVAGLLAVDLAYDPARQRLYALVGDSLAYLELPLTQPVRVQSSPRIGGTPGLFASTCVGPGGKVYVACIERSWGDTCSGGGVYRFDPVTAVFARVVLPNGDLGGIACHPDRAELDLLLTSGDALRVERARILD